MNFEEADIRNGATQQEEPFRHCTGWLCYWSNVCHKNGEKCRATLFHAMKAYRSTGIAPLILNLRTRWRWVVNFTPGPLYPKENAGTHWLRSWVGPIAGLDLFEEEEIHCPWQDSNPELFSLRWVPMSTALFRVFIKVISERNC
jgi:8-oxo-dGTP pyrophosphatase MutT (NUDIX family)